MEHERAVLETQNAKNHLEESEHIRAILESEKADLAKTLESEREKRELYESKYNDLTHEHAKMQAGDSSEQQNAVRVTPS